MPTVKLIKHSFLALLGIFFFFSCRNGTKASVQPAAMTAAPVAAPSAPSLDSVKVKQGALYHRLDSFFLRKHKFGGFNGNVLVLKGNNIIYKGCFGYCDYASRDTLTTQTPFQIASSSKPFTSCAILKLAEEGRLSLQDTLGKYFPGFPYRKITVEMLLCHRSGLPNYLYFCTKLWKDKKRYMTNDDLVDLLMKNRNIEGTTRPGTHFQYNNTNFALLASIVERVTGQTFPAYMEQAFFKPIGMHNTWIRDVRNEKDARKHAISYNSKWMVTAEDPYDGIYGDKNVFSTLEDMMIWDRAFYEEKNISRAQQKEAYTPRSFEHKGVRNYGYGWRLMKQPNGESLVYHNGWWHGNNTVFYRYVPDTFALIILSNRYNQSVYDVQPVFNIIGGTRDNKPSEGGDEEQQ